MDPFNLQLFDAALRHELVLRRYAAHEIEQIIGGLNEDAFPELLARVRSVLERAGARGHDIAFSDTAAGEKLSRAVADQMDQAMSAANAELGANLAELGVHEAEVLARSIADLGPRGFSLDWTLPAPGVLRSLAADRPMQGRILSDWFNDLAADTAKAVERAVNVGIATGESADSIVSRIRGTRAANFEDGLLQTTRHNAESVVRTAIAHTSAQAREQSYVDNADIIKGVLWISTLDTRTCFACMGLDGQVFDINDGPRPPLHYRCRCSSAPVLKSWREQGFDIDELPPGTRAAMNGEVPATQTYGEWLARQPAKVQDAALGKTRADLFRAGDVKVGDFVDSHWEPLSITQLIAHVE